jgi:hypothetical protein
MADAFAHGAVQPTSALALEAPWPDASRTVAPGGFIPSPVRPDAASPICAPGFSLLMAPFAAVGGVEGIFWVTPIAAAALVWSAFALGRRLAGGMAGVVAATLTAASPIVLFQTVQPMNDITSAALWLVALVAATSESPTRAQWAGLATGIAILVRPNLAPVAAVVLLACGPSLRSAVAFGLAMIPGVAILAGLNRALYGQFLATGYGDPLTLFGVRFFAENVRNYARAFYETQHVFPLVAIAAPLLFGGRARRMALAALAASLAVFASYVFYTPFPEWWYLRFLIPSIVLLIVLASAVVVHAARSATMGGVVVIAAVVLVLLGLRTARERQAFDLQQLESRFRDAGALVGSRLPERAVVLTVWQSGSIRFHARREVVMWDAVAPEWLDRAVGWLADRDRPVYILLERREENEFRARFRGRSALGALDWPPRFDLNRQVRIFDVADRARHVNGETYATENIRRSIR